MRTRLLPLCAFLVVLLVAAPDALAQGGRHGGGRSGGGRPQPQKPKRPTRPDASTSRLDTARRGSGVFAGKNPSSKDISSLLKSGSTGRFPASERSRSELSSSLSETLNGKTLSADQASALSDAVAAGANPDGLTKEDLVAKKGSLQSTLRGTGATDEQIAKVQSAFDNVVSDQQQANLQKLAGDLEGIQGDSQVTQDQVKALSSSLQAMADGATKPSQESVDKLSNDLSGALDDGSLSTMEEAQLTRDMQAVMNSANIPASEVTAAIDDAKTILTASNVDQADVQLVVSDMQAIYAAAPKPK